MAERDGSVTHLTGGVARLVFTRHYSHAPDRVWAMLTQPELIEQWWARADELDPTGGGRVKLTWLNTDVDGTHPVATGRVSAFDPGRVVEYNTDAFGALRFVLSPADDGGTNLAFSASLPLDPAWEAKMLAGWHWRFDALRDALNGTPVDWDAFDHDGWVAQAKRYREKFSWGG